jgi:transcriptional regulator with XRE-family HTH domain
MCGLDRTYVGGIERGERNLSLANIEKIAKTFKVSLSDLFRGV